MLSSAVKGYKDELFYARLGEDGRVNWEKAADEYNPTPYYAVRKNRNTGRDNDLCPQCLAPKKECWQIYGPEDLKQ